MNESLMEKRWHSNDHIDAQLHFFGVFPTFGYFSFMGQTIYMRHAVVCTGVRLKIAKNGNWVSIAFAEMPHFIPFLNFDRWTRQKMSKDLTHS